MVETMPIRKRLSDPERKQTGLTVLSMLLKQGVQRNVGQRCIVRHIRYIWALDAAPSIIIMAELDINRDELAILTNDGKTHILDVSGVM